MHAACARVGSAAAPASARVSSTAFRADASCAQQRGNAECAWRKREFVVPVRKINMVEKRREENSARAASVRAAVGFRAGGQPALPKRRLVWGRAGSPPSPMQAPARPARPGLRRGGLRPPSPRASHPPLGVRGLRRATRHRHCAHPCVRQANVSHGPRGGRVAICDCHRRGAAGGGGHGPAGREPGADCHARGRRLCAAHRRADRRGTRAEQRLHRAAEGAGVPGRMRARKR